MRVSTRHLLVLLAPARAPGTPGRRSAPVVDLRTDDVSVADAHARLGVVASRKVGPAVARNRAKRLVRELFRRNPALFPPGIDMVIIVHPGTHELVYAALEAELRPLRPLLHKRAAEMLRAARAAGPLVPNPKRSGDG